MARRNHTFWQLFRDSLVVSKRSNSWEQILGAGFTFSAPIFISLLFGQINYGLLTALGSFTYLYAFPIPYAQQSRRLLFVGSTLTFTMFLGSLLSPDFFLISLLIGLIAGGIMYLFNALKVVGPSSLFFVLVFSVAVEMPEITFIEALFRAGFVALGAFLSWGVAMAGFLFNPHRPELKVVLKTYRQILKLSQNVGLESCNQERYATMIVLKEAEELLIAGRLPWKQSESYIRLLHLTLIAGDYLLYLSDHYTDKKKPLPFEIIEFLSSIETTLKSRLKKPLEVKEPQLEDKILQRLLEKMKQTLILPIQELKPITLTETNPLKEILVNAFDRNSLVFLSAVRMGVISAISAMIAYGFEFSRPYWIPLSCVAVLQGASMLSTFHRAIQRSVGTIIGIVVASVILYLNPSGFTIASAILLFTILTSILIVKNYGLAVIAITPNALLIVETISGGEMPFLMFAGLRVMDVLIGSVIGLVGVLIMGKRSASSRLPRIIMETLRSEAHLMLLLFSAKRKSTAMRIKSRLIKLKNHVINLNALYDATIGEIPKNQKAIEYYWPIVYSIDKLAFLLERAIEREDRPILTEEALAYLLYFFETLANLANFDDVGEAKEIPHIPNFYGIEKEMEQIQNGFMRPGYIFQAT